MAAGLPGLTQLLVPLNVDTLRIIWPCALSIAFVGLMESLLTAKLVDELTDTPSSKRRECWGLGVSNIFAGFYGGIAGCAMIGQTAQIAPADKKLYALRDVTGTVESIPLISASIMSKKIAEGIDALVLDVKTGSGAFMKSEADSRRLAESLVAIGKASGVQTEAIITAMEAPLGRAVGNALEVIECLDVLKGGGPQDLVDVSVELAARMVVLGRVAGDLPAARDQVRRAIASGAGLDRFRQIIEVQGGDPKIVDDYGRLPHVPDRWTVAASRSGFVTALNAELVGRASVVLGAGRDRVEDPVDPAVGIMVVAKPGDEVRAGDPVLAIHFRDSARLEAAKRLTDQAITIGDAPPVPGRLIVGEVR